MDAINLEPIGFVSSHINDTYQMPVGIKPDAVVEIYPRFQTALYRIEEFSHIWILAWFHLASRDELISRPKKIRPDALPSGVFALRSPIRPNPIALTLVRLHRVDVNRLYVNGLDAVNGTPVLDIKPYNESDIVFSPRVANFGVVDETLRRELMMGNALAHHQEECIHLLIAVRMAMVAEKSLGPINASDLLVSVTGTPCLADTIQGLTRARLANPARFNFRESDAICQTTWRHDGHTLTITLRERSDRSSTLSMPDDALFEIRRLDA